MVNQDVINKKLSTNVHLYIKGEEYDFVSLELKQAFGEHHAFKVVMDYDNMKDHFMGNPSKYMLLIREVLDIDLLQGDDNSNVYEFRGIITNVYHEGKEGKHGYLVLEGLSPTVLLERGKRMDIFTQMDLKQVFEDVVTGVYNKQLSYVNNPVYSDRIGFLMQYNESDWEFLRRLSAITGEALYYTGRDLVFGVHKDWKETELTYDHEITNFQFGSRLLANNFNRYQYLSEQDDTIKYDSTDNIDSASEYVKDVSIREKDFVGKRPVRNPSPLEVSNIGALTELVNREKTANAAHTVYVKGVAKTCSPRIGRLLTIKMPSSMPEASDIGTYRITKVIHRIDQNHRYTCEFEGIPAELKFYPTPEIEMPVAESIRGVVISNEDTEGQGRVRVDFPFAADRPSETWLRVMTPSAGLSNDGQKNRGMVFIPEKGDQVMVGFEFGDPNRPYVMGSMFHGENGTGGGINNKQKSIITRSGIKIIFDDDQKSLHIEDPSGNTWDMDGKGNIAVNAPENMTITVGKNMDISVGKNISVSARENITVDAGKNIDETAAGDINQTANGDINEAADNKTEIVQGNYDRTSETSTSIARSITSSSIEENMILQSGKTVKMNSVEKTNLF